MRWIGKRIRDLRLARGLPLDTRSYQYKVERGGAIPGLAVLEKIAEQLGVGLWRFLVSDEEHERLLMMEDPFVMAVKLFMHDLSAADKEQILKVLAAAPSKAHEWHGI